jgi:hypothetical protein
MMKYNTVTNYVNVAILVKSKPDIGRKTRASSLFGPSTEAVTRMFIMCVLFNRSSLEQQCFEKAYDTKCAMHACSNQKDNK